MTKTITVSDETYDAIKSQLSDEEQIDVNFIEDLVGKKFFIRTVTYHALGKITKKIGSLLQLEDASWIADSGRFSDAIKDGFGTNAEIEPVGKMFVNINSIVDLIPWKHPLPTKKQ